MWTAKRLERKDELISVIVPVHKVEQYITKCVESIKNQTYKNLEILLIDDGTSESSSKICDAFSMEDKRIRTIYKKNGDLSDARNVGIDKAEGTYVLIVNGDDYINKNMVLDLYQALTEQKCDMSICNFLYVDEKGDVLVKYNANMPIKDEIISGLEAIKKLSERKGDYYTNACNKLYKKDLFKGISFPSGKSYEDEFISHEVFGKCDRIACLENPYYYRVQRQECIVNSDSSIDIFDKVEAYIGRSFFLKKIGEEQLASYYYYYAVRIFSQEYGSLDKFEKKVKERIKELHKIFRKNYSEFLGNCSLKQRVHIAIVMNAPRMHQRVVKMIASSAKRRVFLKTFFKILLSSIKKRILNHGEIIYFISTPSHGNLGDQAIVLAQYELFKHLEKVNSVIEITRVEYTRIRKWLDKIIRSKDIIVIDGGGNIGTLWIEEEEKMRDILKRFPQNRVYIFPQTAYFEKSVYGENELEKSIDIYQAHKKLTVFCRDSDTYELFQKRFPKTKVYFTPDIVLYLKPQIEMKKRKDVSLCFRKDLEKKCSIDGIKDLKDFLKKNEVEYREITTVIKGTVSKKERVAKLDDKWKEFSESRLVVTDRLHGMIFCAITGTPCIALDNVSHKVRNGYNWISYLPYITFVDDESKIIEAVCERLENPTIFKYNREPLEEYFSIIEKAIQTDKERS